MDMEKCGAFIRERRSEKGLSQQELAQQLHVTREAVSKWENGRGFPDVSLLQRLAETLEVSVSELLLGELGERDEAALYNWIFLTETEQRLQKRSSRYLLLGVFLCLAANAMLGRRLTLPMGVAALALPLALALRGNFSLGSITLSSFGFCLAAIGNELQEIRHRVTLQDWAGLGDTIDVSITICVVLAVATVAANALLFAGRKK